MKTLFINKAKFKIQEIENLMDRQVRLMQLTVFHNECCNILIRRYLKLLNYKNSL